jgi:altronate dehydratase small subunit
VRGDVLGDAGLQLHADDTVVTAIEDLEAGTELPVDGGDGTVALVDDVPFGHKVALVGHDAGDTVVKYGETVGRATERVDPGEWVHTHNCESTRGRGDVEGATR